MRSRSVVLIAGSFRGCLTFRASSLADWYECLGNLKGCAVTAAGFVALYNDFCMPKTVKGRGRPRAVGSDRERVVDAILLASRVLVGVAARSLAAVDPDVTLPQYRALVVLATAGPKNLGSLSELLEVHSSTATRLCDRLVGKGLIDRTAATADRREIVLSLTRKGRGIVDRVTQRRRAEIARIVDRIPVTQRTAMIGALQRFGEAAGEVPEQAWSLGWATA